jgi:glycosyltransferase involved in cell wall biosynthesis
LSTCLELIQPVLTMYSEEISLLIIDNASRDNTEDVVQAWFAENPEVDATYLRKESNTGAMDSIMLGIDHSASNFFMFIGDDDTLYLPGIGRLIEVLKRHPYLGILIEADIEDGPNEVHIEEPSVAITQRRRFLSGSPYYKFGNAWAGIYNVETMKLVLSQPNVRERIVKSVWGQCELGLMAAESRELMIGTLMFNYGRPHAPNPFRSGGLTSIISARHLLESSLRLQSAFGAYENISVQLGDGIKAPITQHMIAILRTWPPDPSKTYLSELNRLRDAVEKTFTFKTGFWLRVFIWASLFPVFVRLVNLLLNLRLGCGKEHSNDNINHHT